MPMIDHAYDRWKSVFVVFLGLPRIRAVVLGAWPATENHLPSSRLRRSQVQGWLRRLDRAVQPCIAFHNLQCKVTGSGERVRCYEGAVKVVVDAVD